MNDEAMPEHFEIVVEGTREHPPTMFRLPTKEPENPGPTQMYFDWPLRKVFIWCAPGWFDMEGKPRKVALEEPRP